MHSDALNLLQAVLVVDREFERALNTRWCDKSTQVFGREFHELAVAGSGQDGLSGAPVKLQPAIFGQVDIDDQVQHGADMRTTRCASA